MKWIFASALLLAISAGTASAAGCLSGAAIGTGVGHFAGHHAVLGGLAGCAIGHHHAKVVEERHREEAAKQQAEQQDRWAGPRHADRSQTDSPVPWHGLCPTSLKRRGDLGHA